MRWLIWLGQRGKWVLPLGLIAALVLPQFAQTIQSAIAPLLAALLVISYLQINQSLKAICSTNFAQTALLVLSMQLALPVILYFLLSPLGVSSQWLIPICLVAAASCIAGGPSIVMMLGGDGARAIQLLILSTLSLPFTSLPTLHLLPFDASQKELTLTALKLALVVLGSYAVAQLLKRVWTTEPSDEQRACLDGLSALLLALIVIGLMGAIHTAWHQPVWLLTTLLLACSVNAGFQFVGVLLNRLYSAGSPIVLGVLTGNRAVAIYLTALPASVYEPFLLFIACYQIPMYLTPLLGQFMYGRLLKR